MPLDSDGFVMEVYRLTTSMEHHTILIVQFKDSQLLKSGIPLLEQQIKQQTDAALSGATIS